MVGVNLMSMGAAIQYSKYNLEKALARESGIMMMQTDKKYSSKYHKLSFVTNKQLSSVCVVALKPLTRGVGE